MSELDSLVPQAIELVVGGEPLAIQPLKVGQLPGFVRAISPVLQPLMGGSGMNSTGSGIDWLTLLGTHGDDLLAAVAIAVGKPRAWVDDLAADEAILVAAKVIEVNADFFTRAVLPQLDSLFGAAGLPPSLKTPTAGTAMAGSPPSST